MRSYRLLLGLVPALPVAAIAASCGSRGAAQIDLVMRAPMGALDGAKAVTLSVFDASGRKCSESTGHVSEIPSEKDGAQVFPLKSSDCLDGAAWCEEVELERGEIDKMFAILAEDDNGLIAEGCTVRKIDQDPLVITIKMHLSNEALCCNDGFVQAGEQCEGTPVGDTCDGIEATDVCDTGCIAKEIELAVPSEMEPPLPEGGKAKTDIAMAFGPGDGQLSGALRTVYTSRSTDAVDDEDVNFRALNKDLSLITDPPSYAHQLVLPMTCGKLGDPISVKKQSSGAIAALGQSIMGVVYLSDELSTTRAEVFLSPITVLGCADLKQVRISTSLSVSDPAERPDIAAGPGGQGLAVWVRGGEAYGRIWEPPTQMGMAGTFTPPDMNLELTLAPSALDGTVTSVRVAGTPTGWVIVYSASGEGDSDGGIYMDTVNLQGGTSGKPTRVNAADVGVQDQPDVAVLKDGTRIVVWRSNRHIYFQRYDADGVAIGVQFNDVENPLSPMDREQANPAVAASSDVGSFFVVAWEEVETTDVWARIVDPVTGFVSNSVTGQADAFPAGYPGFASVRKRPAVAIGGHIAIGWHDENEMRPGVIVRRFPIPQL